MELQQYHRSHEIANVLGIEGVNICMNMAEINETIYICTIMVPTVPEGKC